jgi:hypothetical protein
MMDEIVVGKSFSRKDNVYRYQTDTCFFQWSMLFCLYLHFHISSSHLISAEVLPPPLSPHYPRFCQAVMEQGREKTLTHDLLLPSDLAK